MSLKHRLVGAAVIVAGLVIFVPMLIEGGKNEKSDRRVTMEMKLPPLPKYAFDQAPLPNPDREFNFRSSERAPEDEIPPPSASTPISRPPAEPVKIVPPRRSSTVAAINPPAPTHSMPVPTPAKPAVVSKPVIAIKPITAPMSKPMVVAKPMAAPAVTQAQTVATAPMPSGGFVVQVGGFADPKNAQQMRDRLLQDGFSAFIDSSRPGGKIPHKVKVGPEPDRASADALRARISSQEHIQGFVTAQP